MSSTEPPDWLVALVPLFFHESNDGSLTARVSWRQTIFMDKHTNEDDRKRFYKALLKIDWLPSSIRGGIQKELGSSLRKQKHDFKHGETVALRHMIKETKARLRKQGERKRGGIYDAAVAEVAERTGVTVEALKKQLQRYK